MTKANECTCPSGDGSLRHPCPAHPAPVELAGVAATLTFINGRPAMCGCQVEYSSGGGEYSDVIYVTLCAKHSGSAILDLVATNRIALTPEYEGQWHADLYLDREIPLAKAEGATPAEAVLALMSAERIDPEQESVEQAGGDERDLQGTQGERDGWGPFPIVQVPWNVFDRAVMWVEDRRRYGDDGTIVDDWKALKTIQRAALAQPSGEVVVTKNESGTIVSVTRQDKEGRVLSVIAESQPSPAQAEQAEAERPEVVAWRYGFSGGIVSDKACLDEWKSGGEYQSLMTVAQHERIVGELRAVIAQLRQHKNDYMDSGQQTYRALQNEIREREAEIARLDGLVSGRTAERDAALARVAELEKQEPVATVAKVPGEDWNGLHFYRDLQGMQPGTKLYAAPVAQAQHSVPEGYALVPLEPTDDMLVAGQEAWTHKMERRGALEDCEEAGDVYRAMLAAAPGKEGV
ncbi:TPA: hypothetical protein SLW38_006089 [Pseudomonas aeruginosa]|uniref:hypothetical protein n=1 Tax=Pseudomonas aeruginosa TaxID=287 RepID=UPI001A2787AE|nr:hypothetical protein [Pseudomonas aeruginosa]EKV4551463.1 hypothetical protein [Pseudomonas aeruginosa]MBG6316872.1 hypothetical protein [Pseudomonas aeruginosa]MBI8882186.1 hypothetical protein [Pseudomonas aeruginosa]MCC0162992.1 hypothetical protein [Pseudomonas aeruginosa]MCS8963835.1 hypothetical protein [Pseudomonas aeruginosa]